MITPTTEVNIWNHDGETVPVKLITLTVWASALKAEVKGYRVSKTAVAPIVKKFLNCPSDYDIEMLSDHITGSLESVKSMMGIR